MQSWSSDAVALLGLDPPRDRGLEAGEGEVEAVPLEVAPRPVTQTLGVRGKYGVGPVDQDDAGALRIEVAEVSAQRTARQLGDLPGQLRCAARRQRWCARAGG